MNNNPVARRQLYRPMLICQLPAVRWIDGRETTYDERERAEVLLKSEKPLKFFLQEIRPGAGHTQPTVIPVGLKVRMRIDLPAPLYRYAFVTPRFLTSPLPFHFRPQGNSKLSKVNMSNNLNALALPGGGVSEITFMSRQRATKLPLSAPLPQPSDGLALPPASVPARRRML